MVATLDVSARMIIKITDINEQNHEFRKPVELYSRTLTGRKSHKSLFIEINQYTIQTIDNGKTQIKFTPQRQQNNNRI